MTTNPKPHSGAPADGIEPELVSALTEVIDGLTDNDYTVSANYLIIKALSG